MLLSMKYDVVHEIIIIANIIRLMFQYFMCHSINFLSCILKFSCCNFFFTNGEKNIIDDNANWILLLLVMLLSILL